MMNIYEESTINFWICETFYYLLVNRDDRQLLQFKPECDSASNNLVISVK